MLTDTQLKDTDHLVKGPIDKQAILDSLYSDENGAIVTFSGDVREPSQGKRTSHIDYSAYPEMAEKSLQDIETQAMDKFEITALRIVHRLGTLQVGETSVFIAVSSRHRAAAFEACRFAIEELKQIVPIWKEEHFLD